ncbi:cupin domain-containing protein [Paenibacillus lignilyticus]|uniref:Cupin domain-containing protein n=1 Tax=Paenibacillus lignilyticus TaxID=1172615 RepID=A0ABS5CIV7_9BACL|nr:cupin domain-containing protein [Paenibacillus lignilyticus]MBP3965739.1 cupin domain-containing protein [Paenibacillus lignilyticus]
MARKQSPTSMRWIYPPDYDERLGMDAVGTSIIPELIVLGCQKYSEAYQLTLHRHMTGYEFVYLEHGSVTWEVDGVQYPTTAGQWFFTAPGELHKARFNHIEPSRIWWFIITDPACDSDWLNLGQQERNFIKAGLQQLPHVFRADVGWMSNLRG